MAPAVEIVGAGPAGLSAALTIARNGGRAVLDDLTRLEPGRRWLGYATFVLLASILVPFPRALWTAVGIHCPYLGEPGRCGRPIGVPLPESR